MLTPLFRVAQDERFLLLTIRAPHCSLRNAELSYDGRVFLFHAKPYFLRLFLPADVVDDESGTCEYDAEDGIFTVQVPKKTPGEHFPRLEMLTELLRPQEPNAQRLLEELDGEEVGEDEDFDCFAQQSLSVEGPTTSSSTLEQFGYGFGWQRHSVLDRLLTEIGQEEFPIDLEQPDETPIDGRLERLHAFDTEHFRPEHYLADLHESEQTQLDAMEFDPFQTNNNFELNEQDNIDLKNLTRRKLPHFSRKTSEQIARSLVDILFGFLYDFRTTSGEHTIETGWTCSRLAPSLTFLLRWPSTREAVRCTVRHSLVLPLYRNWALSLSVFRDVRKIFKIGPVAVLHCLLTIRRFFNRGDEFRYLFNQLFMDELCLWVQTVPEEFLQRIGDELETELGKLKKADITELDLETIELEAKLALLNPLDSDDEEQKKA